MPNDVRYFMQDGWLVQEIRDDSGELVHVSRTRLTYQQLVSATTDMLRKAHPEETPDPKPG